MILMSDSFHIKYWMLFIFLVSILIFTRHLSMHGLEYRDDEIFYYKSSQEMLSQHNYLSPTYFGGDRFQKPILFYWLIMGAFKLFGVSWFSARIVSSIFGALTVALTWLLAKRMFDAQIAWLSAVILVAVPLFFRHAKNAVPDMALNFFIVLALVSAYLFVHDPKKQTYSYVFFISCGLGFMVKGIAALVIPIVTVFIYCLMDKKMEDFKKMNFGYGLTLILFITVPWFLYMIKVHGKEYWNYMLIQETHNRVIGVGRDTSLMEILKTFIEHSTFYPKIIMGYFAPWSIFFYLGMMLMMIRVFQKVPESSGLIFLLVWVGVVYLIFSSMKFLINHYMLVMTTPFALTASYFFLSHLEDKSLLINCLGFFRKWFLIFIFCIVFIGFTFLVVFLAKESFLWLLVLAIIFIGLLYVLITARNELIRPLILGLCIIFIFSQSNLLFKAGVISHATLQKMAETVVQDKSSYVVGIGSHDIHEKEFQVYFDKPVVKAATSLEQETHDLLRNLFKSSDHVYCLFIRKDFDDFVNSVNFQNQLEIIQKELIMRRRMKLDFGFVQALIHLNRDKIDQYLKEEIILVRKVNHVN